MHDSRHAGLQRGHHDGLGAADIGGPHPDRIGHEDPVIGRRMDHAAHPGHGIGEARPVRDGAQRVGNIQSRQGLASRLGPDQRADGMALRQDGPDQRAPKEAGGTGDQDRRGAHGSLVDDPKAMVQPAKGSI
jgi:hypothetical protein